MCAHTTAVVAAADIRAFEAGFVKSFWSAGARRVLSAVLLLYRVSRKFFPKHIGRIGLIGEYALGKNFREWLQRESVGLPGLSHLSLV
jgi:hypothetical protein